MRSLSQGREGRNEWTKRERLYPPIPDARKKIGSRGGYVRVRLRWGKRGVM